MLNFTVLHFNGNIKNIENIILKNINSLSKLTLII